MCRRSPRVVSTVTIWRPSVRDISDLGDEEDAIPHGVSDGTAALALLRQDDAGVSIAPVSRQKE